MLDSHCHLDFPEFDPDRSRLLDEARGLGIVGWLVPGVHRGLWEAQDVLRSLPGVRCAVGLHPWWLPRDEPLESSLAALEERARQSEAVAIGECGLDAQRGDLDVAAQLPWFEAQLALANQRELPVIIHQVGARREFLQALQRVGTLERGGVVHGFSGDASWARALLARGLHLGFGARVLSPRRERLRDAFRSVPLDRVLLETDAPLGGRPGQRLVPADLAAICRDLAALRGISGRELAEASDANLERLLGPAGSFEEALL